MNVNGPPGPWVGQYGTLNVSLSRIDWRQIEKTTRTGEGSRDGGGAEKGVEWVVSRFR